MQKIASVIQAQSFIQTLALRLGPAAHWVSIDWVLYADSLRNTAQLAVRSFKAEKEKLVLSVVAVTAFSEPSGSLKFILLTSLWSCGGP